MQTFPPRGGPRPAASLDSIPAVFVATADELRERIRRKSKLKGRQVDESSVLEVRALVGPGPHRRDLLIEHLHKLTTRTAVCLMTTWSRSPKR